MAAPRTSQPYVNAPMSLMLDVVRTLAALMVVAGHGVFFTIYRGPWPFSGAFQHAAVVIFFVLSGLVIASSVFERETTPSDYIIARLTRILPVSLPAIFLGIGAYAIVVTWAWYVVPLPNGYVSLTRLALILPLMFMSESPLGEGPAFNLPYWSLCYEVWYYILFAVAVYMRGARRALWLAIGLVLAGPRVLFLMPAWLIGVAMARWRPGASLSRPLTGVIWIVAGIAALTLAATYSDVVTAAVYAHTFLRWSMLHFSQHFLTDWIGAAAVAAIFIGLRPVALHYARLLERAEGPIRSLAGSSFTLYLLHWPIMCVMRGFGVATTSFPVYMLILAAFQGLALVLAHYSEAKRYILRDALRRASDARRQPPLGA